MSNFTSQGPEGHVRPAGENLKLSLKRKQESLPLGPSSTNNLTGDSPEPAKAPAPSARFGQFAYTGRQAAPAEPQPAEPSRKRPRSTTATDDDDDQPRLQLHATRKAGRQAVADSDDEPAPADSRKAALAMLFDRHKPKPDAVQPEPVAKAARGRKLGREPAEAMDTGGYIGKAQKAMRVDLTLDGHEPLALSEVGKVEQEDGGALDDVLATCEGISASLRDLLGSQAKSGTLGEAGPQLVTRESLEPVCGSAAQYLKQYQLLGVNFLMHLARAGVAGAILADDMGLGKTCQLICFLGALRVAGMARKPHVVVAPASVLDNWKRELQRWCPALRVVAYYGPAASRAELRAELGAARAGRRTVLEDSDSEEEDGSFTAGSPQKQRPTPTSSSCGSDSKAPFDVLLTCYTLFERQGDDQKRDRTFLCSWQWSHMVMDEAHAVKNAAAGRTQRMTRLACCCERRIMLTGTPLQNDLHELHNLLLFLVPDVFKELPQLEDSGDAEDALAQRMKRILQPFVLRRVKADVAQQLPTKQHQVLEVSMVPTQAETYREAVAQLRSNVASRSSTRPGSKAASKALGGLAAGKISNIFVHLRKVALHPLLVRRQYDDARVLAMARLACSKQTFGDASLAKVRQELGSYSDHGLHELACQHGSAWQQFRLPKAAMLQSAKFQALQQLLPKLQAASSRALIFSQWTQVLELLEWLLDELRLPFLRLDGTTPLAQRQALVDQFNSSSGTVFAMLMTTRAGGQGLNLTGADTVILHDVDFNPQIDRQAEDRCHRIGQTRPVTVYRLVTKDTVDVGIHQLAQKKLKLDLAVLGGSQDSKAKASEAGAMKDILTAMLDAQPAASAAPVSEPTAPVLHEPTAADSRPCKHGAAPVQCIEID